MHQANDFVVASAASAASSSFADGFASQVFDGPEVSLAQMLDARERRSAAQARLIARAPKGSSLLSMTLRIPGPHKTSAVLVRVFEDLRSSVHNALGPARLIGHIELGGATGPELLELVDIGAVSLQRTMVSIEQTHPLGSLVDLDVFDTALGELRPLSRTTLGVAPRRCFVCGGQAKACARSRAHTVAQLEAKITSIIKEGGLGDHGSQG